MTPQTASPDSLRVRLGAALQRERLRRGLSQAQLAKLANLSLKYIGEIERGEANPTMDALEQLATALQWNPLELSLRDQDRLPESVRTLVLAELVHIQQLVETAIGWLQRLDKALARPDDAKPPDDNIPIRRRGRPRMPRPVEPQP